MGVWHFTETVSAGPMATGKIVLNLVTTTHPLLCFKEDYYFPCFIQHPTFRFWMIQTDNMWEPFNVFSFGWLIFGKTSGRTTCFHTLVLAADSAQLTGQWGHRAQRDLEKTMWGRDSPDQMHFFSKYAIIYKVDILHIYSKDRDIHTYVHMLYIHLFTVNDNAS